MTNYLAPARSVRVMRKPLPKAERGFTLIEMIAAFVIFAIAVGALMQILTQSLHNARQSRDETRAALWAQTLLDNVGMGEPVEAGGSSGEFDREFRWEMQIEQIDPQMIMVSAGDHAQDAGQALAAAAGQELPQIDLFHVDLRVTWGKGGREHSARFSTLRTARSDMPERRSSGGSRVGRSMGPVDLSGGQRGANRAAPDEGRRK